MPKPMLHILNESIFHRWCTPSLPFAMATAALALLFHLYRTRYRFNNHQYMHMRFFVDAAAVNEPLTRVPVCRPDIQVEPNTFASFLDACNNVKALKRIHARMVIDRFDRNIQLGTKLAIKYMKSGVLEDARHLFGELYQQNISSWNTMIRGFARNGSCEEALMLYYQMLWAGMRPNNFTFPFVLKACAGLSALREGKSFHYHTIRTGLESDVFVGAALIDMYAKCGSVEDARHVFDKMTLRDSVLWTAMIAGYAQNGHAIEAMALFHQMQAADVLPDSVTMVSVLSACAQLGALQEGKWVHDYIIRSGFGSDVSVGNSLVAMYAKSGSIEVARQLFDKMSKRDVVSWNAMIAGYTQNGHANEALTLFNKMQLTDVKPNPVTIVCALSACAHLAALQQGKWIHDYIVRRRFGLGVFLGNSLLDMYAKCGRIEVAHELFDKMPEKDVVSWNAMIAGYGMHGYGKVAAALFRQMQRTGMKPNYVTFVCVLSACSHAGLVDEGWQYFNSMSRDYCITPRVKHYACMVDLLGRAGHLDEAQDFIKRMPLEPDEGVWGALLGACRIHRNIELGERVAEILFVREPKNAGYYVLLSNIYATAGRWNDVAKVRTLMKDRGVKKAPGCSFVEVNSKVHAFLNGDRSPPQCEEIFATLATLFGQMKEAGYAPDMNSSLHDVEEEEKEYTLFSHSEKLAIVFGLINTQPGSPIQITKNLRVCSDCHNATKFISKISGREIIVRDANRFHCFKDGLCSCGDYW